MKRLLIILLAIVTVISLCGCASDGADQKKAVTGGSKTVSDILDQGDSTDAPASTTAANVNGPADNDASDVDVDLTELSATMVYSEVLNMLQSPDDYLGKSVRMSGSFAVAQGEDRMYYACIIKDATQCCSNGIEFIWDGEHSYPEDYPKEGADITVVGVFDKYYEGESMYIQLIDAQLSF